MSTRGSLTFVASGVSHTTYNHSDSYFSWLGVRALAFARENTLLSRSETNKAKTRLLVPVSADGTPTARDIAKLNPAWHQDVSMGTDWYAYLRGTQGDPQAILDSGYIVEDNRASRGGVRLRLRLRPPRVLGPRRRGPHQDVELRLVAQRRGVHDLRPVARGRAHVRSLRGGGRKPSASRRGLSPLPTNTEKVGSQGKRLPTLQLGSA